MTETVVTNAYSLTDVIVQTVPAPGATLLEVTSASPSIALSLVTTLCGVQVVIVGGAPGGDGRAGRDGVDGAAAALIYSPPSASASWLVSHTLGRYPLVQVVASDGEAVGCRVRHLDLNLVEIQFSAPTNGTALLF